MSASATSRPRRFAALRRAARLDRPRAGSGQPDRRAHRLQRRFRPADGHRPRHLDRAATARGRSRASSVAGLRPDAREFSLERSAQRAGRLDRVRQGRRLGAAGGRLPAAGLGGRHAGDVPVGAGLSSSAALEMATARAFAAVSGFAVGRGRAWPSWASAPRTSGSA